MKGRITREDNIGKRGIVLRLAKDGQLGRVGETLVQLGNTGMTATTGTILNHWM